MNQVWYMKSLNQALYSICSVLFIVIILGDNEDWQPLKSKFDNIIRNDVRKKDPFLCPALSSDT